MISLGHYTCLNSGFQTPTHDRVLSFKKDTVPIKGFNNWSMLHTPEKTLSIAQHGFFPRLRQQVKRDQPGEEPNRETARSALQRPRAWPSPPRGRKALFSKEKGQHPRWPKKPRFSIALFGASIADHLQARNAKIAVLLVLGGILNLSFLLFLFCLSLRFSAGRPGHRYFVAKVVFQLNRAAT